MPPIRNAAPRSPDFVRKQCSSQKPCRFNWPANEPASFQSFEMSSILTIAPHNANLHCVCLHRVVAPAEFAGIEQHAQNLDVVLCGNSGDDDAHNEQGNSA